MVSSVVDLAQEKNLGLPTLTSLVIPTITAVPSASALPHLQRSLGLGMWTTFEEELHLKLKLMGYLEKYW